MRVVIVLLLAFLLVGSSSESFLSLNLDIPNFTKKTTIPTTTRTFEQTISHNDTNLATFQQRYEMWDQWFDPEGGKLFFYMTPLFDSVKESLTKEPFITWFSENKAAVYLLEHRYFGESFPYTTLDYEKLYDLTVEEAVFWNVLKVEDAVTFIQWINQERELDDPTWISIGCGYAGALALWMREKHPDIVFATVASSPFLQAKDAFPQYFEMLDNVLSPACQHSIFNASRQLQSLLTNSQSKKELQNIFPICKNTPLENSQDRATELNWMAAALLPVSFNLPIFNMPLDSLCLSLETTSSAEGALQIWGDYLRYTYFLNQGCIDLDLVGFFNISDIASLRTSGLSSWAWLSCTQLGWFETLSPDTCTTLTSDVPLSWLHRVCKEGFDLDYNPYTIAFNASNVMILNGNADPWLDLSVSRNKSGITLLTYPGAHCAPFTSPTPYDPEGLIATRSAVLNFLLSVSQIDTPADTVSVGFILGCIGVGCVIILLIGLIIFGVVRFRQRHHKIAYSRLQLEGMDEDEVPDSPVI